MAVSKKLRDVHTLALAKLGAENTASMVIVAGRSVDGNIENVNPDYADALFGVLTRMTSNGRAVARAQADFTAIDEARAKVKERRTPKATPNENDPYTITATMAQDVFAKWNRTA